MTPILENAGLTSDLDCQNYSLKNIRLMTPVPENLVAINDPRLTGGRMVPDGSVTDDSVNATAAIDQSKLSLNGVIPPSWVTGVALIGHTPKAAAGNLAEFQSRKNVANGYAGLDSVGKVAAPHFAAGPATGSLTQIGIAVPDPYTVTPANISSSGTFAVHWKTAPANMWFGSDGTLDFQHHEFIYPFYVTGDIEGGLLGGVPCSKFVSGAFPVARWPLAKYGSVHNQGMVPDPGSTGAANMYLARDMTYKNFVVNDPAVVYQPRISNPTIVLDDWDRAGAVDITIRTRQKGAFLFYRVTPQGSSPGSFKEVLHGSTPDDIHITLTVNEHAFIEAYAAKQGYINSDIEEWTVITPLTDLGLS